MRRDSLTAHIERRDSWVAVRKLAEGWSSRQSYRMVADSPVSSPVSSPTSASSASSSLPTGDSSAPLALAHAFYRSWAAPRPCRNGSSSELSSWARNPARGSDNGSALSLSSSWARHPSTIRLDSLVFTEELTKPVSTSSLPALVIGNNKVAVCCGEDEDEGEEEEDSRLVFGSIASQDAANPWSPSSPVEYSAPLAVEFGPNPSFYLNRANSRCSLLADASKKEGVPDIIGEDEAMGIEDFYSDKQWGEEGEEEQEQEDTGNEFF